MKNGRKIKGKLQEKEGNYDLKWSDCTEYPREIWVTKAAKLDSRQAFGLTYFDDLQIPISRAVAEDIFEKVRIEALCVFQELNAMLPEEEPVMKICGGYSRGKREMHDVDILIRCPNGVDIQQKIFQNLLRRLANKYTMIQLKRDAEIDSPRLVDHCHLLLDHV